MSSSEHNPALFEKIAARIRDAGPIGFDAFMRLALYDPDHGYYVACDPALDYQTSPQVHPIFGAMVARQLAALWEAMDRPLRFDIFEAGAGDGRLAVDILTALRDEAQSLFEATHYTLQDVSLRGARERLEQAGLTGHGAFVGALPDPGTFEGVILSNELLDALPFRRVRVQDGTLFEVNVALADGRFIDAPAPASPEVRAYFDALALLPGAGCDAEVNLEAPHWLRRAASSLRRGYVMTLDYGYDVPDLYEPSRKRGTMLTFYRHTDGDDPYRRIGRQDITASIDFTSVKQAGSAAGLHTVYEAAQSDFLLTMGLREAVTASTPGEPREALYARRRAAAELTDEAGLGRIRVLIQSKGIEGG